MKTHDLPPTHDASTPQAHAHDDALL